MTETRTVLRADRLIDGSGRQPSENGLLVWEDERIAAVGPGGGDEPGPGVAELRFPGCTILPGLIDAHVHLTMSASKDPWAEQVRENDYQLVLRAAHSAALLLRGGVTTVRDCGARNDTIFDFRAGVEMGLAASPRLLVAGRPITRTGGHCHQWNGEADGPDGVRAAARRLFKQGADFLKIMVTSGFHGRGVEAYVPAYTDAELEAVVDEAHRLGRPVTVHTTGTAGIEQAVRCGVDMIEHLPMMPGPGRWEFDERLAETIRSRNIYVSATISAGYRAHQVAAAGAWVAPRPGRLTLETRIANLRKIYESGLPVVTGTDSGARLTAFGDSVPLEMETMVGVGMPPLEAIHAATGRCARAVGLGDQVGTLEAGKLADVLVVEGDPSRDISAVRNVVAVYQGGREVYRRGAEAGVPA